ncbi:hypothetical protein G6355_11280 [Vibrio cholerae]|uniref:hypothetical protein n=1 Tax=Vibrio cholerae TaxID=666 RepID=UPI002F3432AA
MNRRIITVFILMIITVQFVFILILFNKDESHGLQQRQLITESSASQVTEGHFSMNVKNDSIKHDSAVQVVTKPNWDCSLYHCGELNKNVYPASEKIIEKISSLKGRIFGPNTSKVDIIVAYDVTCSNCMWLKTNVLQPLLNEGYRMFLFPTTYRDIDNLTDSQLSLFANFICNPNTSLDLEQIHSVYENENCSLKMIKQYLTNSKKSLEPFGLQNGTPIIFTKSAIIIGGKELEVIRKYL